MVFAPHVRVTALGRIGTGSADLERFAFSLAVANPNGQLFGQWSADEQYRNDIAADIKAFFGRPTSRINGAAILQEVKFAAIGADGKYVRDATIVDVADQPGGVNAAAVAVNEPPQAAIAVTLDTDRRGPTGRGRFFLPWPNVDISTSTCLISLAHAEGLRDSVAQLVNDINNTPGLDMNESQVVIASSKGYNTPVSGVRVGRVMDTMRSRRRSLAESYTAATLIA